MAGASPDSKQQVLDPEVEERWLQAGDSAALARVHQRYCTRLEAVAFRILGNRADAEDVVQKIFISLRRASFRGTSSLWTYLYRAAVNGSVNVLRTKRRRNNAERQLLLHQLSAPPQLPQSPDSQVLEGEILAGVAKALLQVKPQYRRVLVLRIVHGLTNTEIAESENVPVATVGTWLRRGRSELQHALRPMLRELDRGAG